MTSAYVAEQSKYVNRKIKDIEIAAANKQAWKIVNEISGRKNSNSAKLKASRNGERIKLWHNHFQEMLGSQLNKTDDDDDDE